MDKIQFTFGSATIIDDELFCPCCTGLLKLNVYTPMLSVYDYDFDDPQWLSCYDRDCLANTMELNISWSKEGEYFMSPQTDPTRLELFRTMFLKECGDKDAVEKETIYENNDINFNYLLNY